jgi:hypothetical protein
MPVTPPQIPGGLEPARTPRRPRGRPRRAAGLLLAAVLVTAALAATAQAASVPLGTADSFAVLAGSTVTNTGPSVISGDLGVSPGTAVTGFPPGTVTAGTVHAADAVALQAQSDLATAYIDAAGRSSTATISADLAGRTLTPGSTRRRVHLASAAISPSMPEATPTPCSSSKPDRR